MSPSPGRRMLMVILCIGTAALPARAQTFSESRSAVSAVGDAQLLPSVQLLAPVLATPPRPPLPPDRPATDSSRTLTSLQISFGALQVLDVFSTVRGVNHGMSEANPLMRGLVRHPVAMAAVKGGAAATTIFLVRHVARKNRVAGIAIMAAVNTALSVVVVRNLRSPGGGAVR